MNWKFWKRDKVITTIFTKYCVFKYKNTNGLERYDYTDLETGLKYYYWDDLDTGSEIFECKVKDYLGKYVKN